MSNQTKLFLIILAIGFLGWGFSVIAQESPAADTVTDPNLAVNLDEDIQPEDLGVGDPRVLPDSPFYFLKNWARGIQSFFAFSPVARAELKLKFANEKLIEVKKTIEEKKDQEKIKKAVENYQEEIEKIKSESVKIKENAEENPKVKEFLDKFIHQQTLHQKLLQRLENQVPEEALEKIKAAREKHLERFQEVMLKLEDRKEEITENLNDILERQKGSRFKHFKNLEILLELEEKVPDEAKDAIRKAEENSLKRLKNNLEEMSPEDQERFKEYLGRISGEKETHLEILENLKSEIQKLPKTTSFIGLKKRLEEGKIKILEEVKENLEESRLPLCPRYVWTDPGPCEKGRIIIEKDAQGCPLPPKCIVPETPPPTKVPPLPEVCISLWDPVCGKDGKTYSNQCFAKIAGVEVDYKWVCKAGIKPLERKCAVYTRDGIQETHCATCGNNICEPFETCTSSNCGKNFCTQDCGPLYCAKDCKIE